MKERRFKAWRGTGVLCQSVTGGGVGQKKILARETRYGREGE